MKKKVLIIEDNVDLLEIYKINFEMEGFTVETAKDWMKWIIKLVDNTPSIIILDIMMPSMNWFEVLKTIRDHSSIKVPIVVCSNLSSKRDKDEAMSLWADIYLKKSNYKWEEVVAKAIELLKKD
jgi:two-component system, OmpR family, alkaline phosphatase synthesis response regulator PhoP